MSHPANSTTDGASWHATTILTVRKDGRVVIAGDGQVSLGATIIKANARKVRQLGKGDVIAGFAGATADAFTLFERLEAKLEQYPGQLMRAAVELAKDWRTDRFLRRLEAMMIVADRDTTLVLTGTGDVLEPEQHVMGIGSGGDVCAGGRARAARSAARCGGHRAQGDGNRRRDLRLHQRQSRRRKPAVLGLALSRGGLWLRSPYRSTSMGWIYLLLAGLLEIGFTTAIRYHGRLHQVLADGARAVARGREHLLRRPGDADAFRSARRTPSGVASAPWRRPSSASSISGSRRRSGASSSFR